MKDLAVRTLFYLAVVVSMGGMLLIAEGAARLVESDHSKYYRSPKAVFHYMQYDSVRGYKFIPDTVFEFTTSEFSTTVTINEYGFRGDNDGEMILLGDSFVFGWGVNDYETAAYRLGAINLGVPGYNLRQSLAALDEWATNHDTTGQRIVCVLNESDLRELPGFWESAPITPDRFAIWDGVVRKNRSIVLRELFRTITFTRQMSDATETVKLIISAPKNIEFMWVDTPDAFRYAIDRHPTVKGQLLLAAQIEGLR